MEKNRAKRFRPTEAVLVGFLGARVRFTGDLVDISTSGALVRCSQELEPGSVGRVGFQVGTETVRILAAVRRRAPGVGLAFQFVHMSPRDRTLLQRMLRRFADRDLA